jgi:hypothetical protein
MTFFGDSIKHLHTHSECHQSRAWFLIEVLVLFLLKQKYIFSIEFFVVMNCDEAPLLVHAYILLTGIRSTSFYKQKVSLGLCLLLKIVNVL